MLSGLRHISRGRLLFPCQSCDLLVDPGGSPVSVVRVAVSTGLTAAYGAVSAVTSALEAAGVLLDEPASF